MCHYESYVPFPRDVPVWPREWGDVCVPKCDLVWHGPSHRPRFPSGPCPRACHFPLEFEGPILAWGSKSRLARTVSSCPSGPSPAIAVVLVPRGLVPWARERPRFCPIPWEPHRQCCVVPRGLPAKPLLEWEWESKSLAATRRYTRLDEGRRLLFALTTTFGDWRAAPPRHDWVVDGEELWCLLLMGHPCCL